MQKNSPKCEKCGGSGYLMDFGDGTRPPVQIRCPCKLPIDLARNAERGWRGLSEAIAKRETPLLRYAHRNLWVTCPIDLFKRHLKKVVFCQDVMWLFQVVSDAELMDAWLGGIPAEDVYDPDLQRLRGSVLTYSGSNLPKVVEPPELLIIRTGIKKARNDAMPEVFFETLMRRSQNGDPTWVFDQPRDPFEPGHRSYSEEAFEHIQDWKHLNLTPSPVLHGEGFQEVRIQNVTEIHPNIPDEVDLAQEEEEELPEDLYFGDQNSNGKKKKGGFRR